MSTGVLVNDDCLTKFNELKMSHAMRYVIFKIENQKEIIVESTGDKSLTYQDFVKALPPEEPRYGVVDVQYDTPDGRPQEKIVFVGWSPDNCGVKLRMLYASSKDSIKRKLQGCAKDVQANDLGDLDPDTIIDLMKK
eukprot:GHVL01038612.1.p1 GENE.GHVL01038612.1~~GHVL01038612.1.p1  ORF type:complete len:137 (+),score=19.99 GHVL01038612.1:58-468(+)